MQTFDQSIFYLFQQKLISYEEALRWASNVDEFKLKVQGISTTSEMSRRPDGHRRAKRRRRGGDHEIRELAMKLPALFAVLLALAPSHAAFAQLAPPNARGVAFGHLHFSTQDPAAFRTFWVAFGGRSTPNLDLDLVQLPGVYLVTFQRDQIAPMDDETTPIVTFKVHQPERVDRQLDRPESRRRARRDARPGVRYAPVQRASRFSRQVDCRSPSVLSRASGDAGAEGRAGVVREGVRRQAGQAGRARRARIPGGYVTFGLAKAPVQPTRGHRLDHWGFEVQHLEAFMKNLEASGIAIDRPYRVRRPGEARTALGYVVDPLGHRDRDDGVPRT